MFKPYLTLYWGLFCTKYLVSKHEKIRKLKIFQCDRLSVINFGKAQFKVQKKQNHIRQMGLKWVRYASETSLTPKSEKTGQRKNVLPLSDLIDNMQNIAILINFDEYVSFWVFRTEIRNWSRDKTCRKPLNTVILCYVQVMRKFRTVKHIFGPPWGNSVFQAK